MKKVSILSLYGVITCLLLICPAFSSGQEAIPLNDVALFVAGIPVGGGSALSRLQENQSVREYQKQCRELSEKWEKTRLSKIRKWATEEIHPKIQEPSVVKYMFSGPDFVHVATLFPGFREYILCGLEPLGTVPDLLRKNPGELASYLSRLNYTLRSISKRSFFITKEMREDFGPEGIDGVYPVLLYFAAMTGHETLSSRYIKLNPSGELVEADSAGADGIVIQLRERESYPDSPGGQNLYYFKWDLSNEGFQAGGPFTKFLERRPGGVGYAKAASFLMHTEGFSNIRNFLVGNCRYFLEDASGIPASFLARYFRLTYYGNYTQPIDMFSEYDQPGLRAIYRSGIAKPLPFGTGYRYTDKDSIQIFGVHK